MRGSLKLPEGKTVLDVADAARDALEDFLALDPNDKLALSQWLIGPYRRAVAYAPKRIHDLPSAFGLGRSRCSAAPAARPRIHTPSAHARVEQLALAAVVSNAQVLLDQAIDGASAPGAERLLQLIPPTVDVVPVHDAFGGRGYAPQDVSHAKLSMRVLTLLLADYLTRPDDYVAERGPRKARHPSVRMLRLA